MKIKDIDNTMYPSKIANHIVKEQNKEIARLNNIIDELEKDLKTLWNVCWNNDTEMTSYQNEIFDKYYDKFHKKEMKEGK